MALVNPREAMTAGAGGLAARFLGAFSNEDFVFGPDKYGAIEIGGVRLPLQPLVYIRIPRNMQETQIAGSAQNPLLKGASVKEMMGIGEARITIEGVMMTTDSTLTQGIANIVGISNSSEEDVNDDWEEKLRDLKTLFDEEHSLPIKGIYDDREFEQSGMQAKSIFEQLGIEQVVLQEMMIEDIRGANRKNYRLRLIQDRPLEITELLPTEEGT
jgi:hypothetical protein